MLLLHLARSHWFRYQGGSEEVFFFIGSKKNKYTLSSYFLDLSPSPRLLDGTVMEEDCSYRHELLQNASMGADFFEAVDSGALGIDIENELSPPHAKSLHGCSGRRTRTCSSRTTALTRPQTTSC
jgi:hypothetical protein